MAEAEMSRSKQVVIQAKKQSRGRGEESYRNPVRWQKQPFRSFHGLPLGRWPDGDGAVLSKQLPLVCGMHKTIFVF
jgi:hypothetical protein